MSEPTLAQLIMEAERACNDGRWDDAEQAYQRALDTRQNLPAALTGLRRVRALRDRVATILQRIEAADEAFARGMYAQAESAYGDILNQAAQDGIQTYHERLSRQRALSRDLARWKRRGDDLMSDIVQLAQLSDAQPEAWTELLNRFDALLHDLPAETHYEAVGASLRAARGRIEQQIDVQARIIRALEAWRNQDFESVVRLAATLGDSLPARVRDANVYAEEILRREIRPVLANVERLLATARDPQQASSADRSLWDQAFALLMPLRQQYPNNPDIRRVWTRAAMEQGQAVLDSGYHECLGPQRNFDIARDYFIHAGQAFARAAEVTPDDPLTRRMRDHIADLIQASGGLDRCRRSWEADRRDEALAVVKDVERDLNSAAVDGRDHAGIAAIARAMRQAIETEISQIDEYRRLIEEAEAYLSKRHLVEARERFDVARGSVLADQRKRAEAELAQIAAAQQAFEEAIKAGAAAADPLAAVEAFDRAYALWPYGPDIRRLIETALVRAAEAVIDQDPESGLLHARRVIFEFNRDNQTAARLLQRPEMATRVRAAIRDAREQTVRLVQNGPVSEFEPILEELEEIRLTTGDTPGLQKEIVAALADLRRDLERRQRYEIALDRARKEQQRGDWAAAVQLIGEARGALEPDIPEELRSEEERWKRIHQAVVGLGDAPDRLRQAIEVYRDQDFARAQELLEDLERACSDTVALAHAAGGPLPKMIEEIQDSTIQYRKKVTVARAALGAPPSRASEAITRLKEISRMLGSDTVLQKLEQQLTAQQRERIPQLLAEAEAALRSGDAEKALDMVRLALEMEDISPEARSLFEKINRRRRLDMALIQAEADARDKVSTNSLQPARDALRRGLDELQNPDIELPPDVRERLGQLTSLGDADQEMAFENRVQWQAAEAILSELDKAGTQSWECFRVAQIARRWANLARQHATRYVIESVARLGNYLEAYGKAANALVTNPNDDKAIAEIAQFAEKAINQLTESAQNRIFRATQAIQRGDHRTAAENLDSIETEVYARVRSNPQVVQLLDAGSDRVTTVQAEVDKLRGEVRELKEIYDRTEKRIEQAESLYARGDFDQAEGELRNVIGVERVPPLRDRVVALRQNIEQARKEKAQMTIHLALTEGQVALDSAITVQQLDETISRLEQLSGTLNQLPAESDSKQNYLRQIAKLREKREKLVALSAWEDEAQSALAETPPNYLRAEEALSKAIAQPLDGLRQVRLQRQFNEVQSAAKSIREREAALAEAEDFLHKEQYREAQDAIRRAARQGAAVDDLKRWARAGLALEEAREAQKSDDLDTAADLLRRATGLAQGIADAETIIYMCERLSRNLEQQRLRRQTEQDQQRKIDQLVGEATVALVSEQFDEANQKAKAALDLAPLDPKIQQLLQSIREEREIKQRRDQVSQKLTQAREAQKLGDYGRAAALIDEILEVEQRHAEAQALKEEIKRNMELDSVLRQVDALAADRKFRRAREELSRILKELPPARQQKQLAELKSLEDAWQAEYLPLIRRPAEAGRLEEAIAICRQTLMRVGEDITEPARAALEDELSSLVNRLVDVRVSELRTTLDRLTPNIGDIETLHDLISRAEQLRTTTPEPGPDQSEAVRNLLRQLRAAWLSARLDAVGERRQMGKLQAAVDEANTVAREANELGLSMLRYTAFNLVMEIEAEIEQQTSDRNRNEFQQLLSQAQTAYQRANDEQDYRRGLDLVDKATSIDPHHPDVVQLRRDIDHALTSFITTRDVVRQVEQTLRSSQVLTTEVLLQALTLIQTVSEPASQFQTLYSKYRQTIELLLQAEGYLREARWLAALDSYRKTLQMLPELDVRLRPSIEHCQRNLDRVVASARSAAFDALNSQRYKEAVTISLDACNEAGLDLTTDLISQIRNRLVQERDRLRVSVNYEEAIKIERAISHLNEADASTDEAIQALIAEQGQKLEEVVHQIRAALEVDDLSTAEQGLTRASTIAGGKPDSRLHEFQRWLAYRQRVVQLVDRELEALPTLAAQNDWPAVTDRLLELRLQAPAYARLLKASEAFQRQLLAQAIQLRDDEEYLPALARADAAQRLAVAEGTREEAAALRKKIADDYQALKNRLQEAVQRSLDAWDFASAEPALDHALRIAPDDSAFGELRIRSALMAERIATLQRDMDAAWQLMMQGQYAAAAMAFEQVRTLVPSFDEARRWRDYCQQIDQALRSINIGEYGRAVGLLQRAEQGMRATHARRPSIHGGVATIAERRRQAAALAAELGQRAGRMETLREQAWKYYSAGRLDEEAHTLDLLASEEQDFASLYDAALSFLVSSQPASESFEWSQPPLETDGHDIIVTEPLVAPSLGDSEMSMGEPSGDAAEVSADALPVDQAAGVAQETAESSSIWAYDYEGINAPPVEAAEPALLDPPESFGRVTRPLDIEDANVPPIEAAEPAPLEIAELFSQAIAPLDIIDTSDVAVTSVQAAEPPELFSRAVMPLDTTDTDWGKEPGEQRHASQETFPESNLAVVGETEVAADAASQRGDVPVVPVAEHDAVEAARMTEGETADLDDARPTQMPADIAEPAAPASAEDEDKNTAQSAESQAVPVFNWKEALAGFEPLPEEHKESNQ